jgi:hypothetical protein
MSLGVIATVNVTLETDSGETEIVVNGTRINPSYNFGVINVPGFNLGLHFYEYLVEESHNPTNLCGSGMTNGVVPDQPLGVNAGPACGAHDSCYSSSTARQTCDGNLGRDILIQCLRQLPTFRSLCASLSVIYYVGVRRGGGASYEGSGSRD